MASGVSAVGFDLGFQNSYVGIARSGGIETVANEFSDRCTATCVSFSENSRCMGHAAKQQTITNMRNTVHGFTRLLGKSFNDPTVQTELPYAPFKLVKLENGDVGVKVSYLGDECTFRTEQLVSMMLTKLKSVAESNLDAPVVDCVLNTPCFFNDRERRALLDAASIAGLNCLKLINDTTAIGLNYGIYKKELPAVGQPPKIVCFVDMGHSQLQVAVIAFNEGRMKVLATTSDATLGGRDFDRAIFNHFVEEFADKFNIDVRSSQKAQLKLMEECTKVKKLMSANSTDIPLSIDCLLNDRDVTGKINRATFNQLLQSAGILRRVEDCLQQCMQLAGMKHSDLHSVEIVGGCTRVPAVKEVISSVLGHNPCTTLNADEAVARGCALMCAILSPAFRVRDFSIADWQPYAISLAINNQNSHQSDSIEVFPLGHQFPFSRSLTFNNNFKFPIELTAFYTEQHAVPPTDRRIGSYRIAGKAAAAVDDFCKIKARINNHGLFCVTSAALLLKQQEQQRNEAMDVDDPKISDEDAKQDNHSKDDATNSRISAENEIKLSITAQNIMQLPSELLTECQRKEAQMQEQEARERERCNTRNAVEEFVYSIRDRLQGDLQSLSSESERTSLQQQLEMTEQWLYGEGETASKADYAARLQQLQQSCSKLLKRAAARHESSN